MQNANIAIVRTFLIWGSVRGSIAAIYKEQAECRTLLRCPLQLPIIPMPPGPRKIQQATAEFLRL